MIFCATIFNFQSEAANHLSESEKKQNRDTIGLGNNQMDTNGDKRDLNFEVVLTKNCKNKWSFLSKTKSLQEAKLEGFFEKV